MDTRILEGAFVGGAHEQIPTKRDGDAFCDLKVSRAAGLQISESPGKLESQHGIHSRKGQLSVSSGGWLLRQPLVVVLVAHTIFSLGIWNARDGYVEETYNVMGAFRILQSHHPSLSVYNDTIALVLRFVPDPITVLTIVKYLSSLLSTVALYLALSSFSKNLKPGAIIFACFVWIASPLHAPLQVSTSLSLFTFAVMLFGVDCLLLSRSKLGVFGFYCFGILAALLRPEYFLPVILMTLILAGRGVWRGAQWLESHFGWSHRGLCVSAVCLVLAGGAVFCINPPAMIRNRLVQLDKYALFGLGQCYSDFYRKEHPQEIFDPMTEYKAILDREFKRPTGFCAAIRNNPSEALRYFLLNSANNLWHNVFNSLFSDRRILAEKHISRYQFRIVRVVLILGALVGVVRLYHWRVRRKALSPNFTFANTGPNSTVRKVFLLLLLLCTSLVAIVLLVGTPRYFLCWVPLFYLGVAYCADSLLRPFPFGRFEPVFVGVFLILLCSPNYLAPRPNYEFDAVRQVASHVKDHPIIAAWWSEPDAVLALQGKAKAVSIWDGIRQADVENGKFDILLIDSNFRCSKTWLDQREFFERFERKPETYGFKKAKGIVSGRFDIYYRPDAAHGGEQQAGI